MVSSLTLGSDFGFACCFELNWVTKVREECSLVRKRHGSNKNAAQWIRILWKSYLSCATISAAQYKR